MRRALYFLGILDDQDVEWMMRHGQKRTVAPGEHLIEQGTPSDWLYFVLDGSFVVYTRTAARVAELKSGEVVGEISFVDARPPTASVRAEIESKVGAIPRAALQAKLKQDVGFAARFYQSLAVFLADRLRTTTGGLGTKDLQLAEDVEDVDELATHLMANISMAGLRFSEMQRGRWGASSERR
ncbi:MAG TPA: cyclic nucleotide-binding domain-containing protein [Vicinamibacterales bacterium]|nr:cyclic nucleotide-binding domain-containing protein [Vicinamibacterales bacterium]